MRFRMLFTLLLSLIVPAGSASADMCFNFENCYNERGYHAVSLRDIADDLSISKGNLTYYFQKKEDLIEACVVRTYSTYRKPKTPETLGELKDFLTMLVNGKKDKPYYFRNYSQLADLCPKVYAIQRSVIEDFSDIINEAMQKLTASGIMREDCSLAYPGLGKGILTVVAYGIVPERESDIKEQLACIWSILTPCLTEAGRKEWCE